MLLEDFFASKEGPSGGALPRPPTGGLSVASASRRTVGWGAGLAGKPAAPPRPTRSRRRPQPDPRRVAAGDAWEEAAWGPPGPDAAPQRMILRSLQTAPAVAALRLPASGALPRGLCMERLALQDRLAALAGRASPSRLALTAVTGCRPRQFTLMRRRRAQGAPLRSLQLRRCPDVGGGALAVLAAPHSASLACLVLRACPQVDDGDVAPVIAACRRLEVSR